MARVAKIVRTRQVAVDVARIRRYIAADNPTAADRLLARIDAGVRRLSYFPELGSPRDDVRDGCRIWLVTGYRVLYEYDRTTDTVTIIAIVEPYRNLAGIV